MTNLVPQTDLTALLAMPQVDAQKTAAQMMALMSGMAAEKENIDSMTTMLEKQPWYKKCIKTITGKNKATVKEISEHKDKIMSYTSSALAQLYENSKIEQQQIIALGEAVNSVNGQLAATNYELLKTQSAVVNLRNELVQSITGLANALNEKITSVDNFHTLITEIEHGIYDYGNVIASIFTVIAQIDRRTAGDERKLDLINKAMTDKGYLNDDEHSLREYMQMVADLPEETAGSDYYEFYCLTDNTYAAMFAELMQSYVFLPKLEKKSKKVDKVIYGILESYDADPDTPFTTNDLYDYFIEGKKDYLTSIQDANVIETTAVEQPQAQIAAETTADAPAPDAQAPFMPEATETAAEPAAEKTETVTDTATAVKSETVTAADTKPAVESEPDAPTPFMPETKEAATEPAAEPVQPGADETAGLEDLVIDSILQIQSGETYEISNKTVRFARSVTCDGTLSLKNCVVYYNDTNAGGTVKLSGSAKVCAENCTFICCGYSSELFFIHGDYYSSAVFTNCVFNDCMYFVGCRELSISRCTLNNCAGSFAYVDSIMAKDIKILNTRMPDFIVLPADKEDDDEDDDDNVKKSSSQEWRAVIDAYNGGTITDAYIEASDAYNSAQKAVGRYNYYFSGGQELKNSKFVNCNSCFYGFDTVEKCQFEKCGYHRFLSRADSISGCKFTDCNGPLLYYCNKVSFCEFINCTNYSAEIYARDSFFFTEEYKSLISFNNVSSGCTGLSNCCFENTDAFYGFIVHVGHDGETLYKNDSYHLRVKNCDFINCRTRRSSGAVIKTYYTVRKKDVGAIINSEKTVDKTCVDISECKGLDSIKIVDDDDILEAEDVFTVTGRGTVLTGTLKNRSISLGSKIYVNGNFSVIKGIEHQHKIVDRAEPGDEVGILTDLKRDEVKSGSTVYLV